MAPGEAEEKDYRVEVSGWDVSENFFVEKTTLNWCEDGSKKVFLQSELREGSLVFVRLNDNSRSRRGIPVTYQIARISAEQTRRGHEVRLRQLHPRFSEHCIHAGSALEELAKQ